MVSQGGHILQGIIFLSLGVWHLICFFATYVKSPREYTARAWYPVGVLPLKYKHLELYGLLFILPLAIFYDLGISAHFQPQRDGGMPTSSIMGFEHVTILFMFWLFALTVLVSDSTAFLPFPTEGSFLFASLAFGLQWLSITHSASQRSDFERQCSNLLAYTAAASAVSSGLLVIRPRAFLVNLVLCLSLILQGTWQFQMALSLYSDNYIPLGCEYSPAMGGPGDFTFLSTTRCDANQAANIRAVALMNFAFNCHVIAVVFFAVSTFGIIARFKGHRRSASLDSIVADFEIESELVQLNQSKLSFERR